MKMKAVIRKQNREMQKGMSQNAKKGRIPQLLIGAACLSAFLMWRETGACTAYARGQEDPPEKWKRYSEIYDSPDMIPDPPEEFTDEKGESYLLLSQRVEEVPITGRKKCLSGQVVYQDVSRDAIVPQTAKMEVQDEESGQIFETELPFAKAVYERERWKGDFGFTVTFHTYGADYYRLGEIRIPHDSDKPPLEMCRAELLEAIGMSEEDCRIESFYWDGEAYIDENGVQCRNARAAGIWRVWDCRAVYSGEVLLPDYTRYRLLAEYARTEPESQAPQSREEEALRETPSVSRAAGSAGSREKALPWLIWLRRSIAASLSLLFTGAMIWGFRRLLVLASGLQKEADREKEE